MIELKLKKAFYAKNTPPYYRNIKPQKVVHK